MKKIVIVTPYFWPEISSNVPLVKDLALFLNKNGFNIIILTSRSSKKSKLINNINKKQNDKQLFCKLKIFRFYNPFARKPGLINKILDYLLFSIWVNFKIIFIKKIDICYVYSNPPLLALPINIIAKKKKFKTIYDLQDLFPNSARAGGFIENNSYIFRFLRSLEARTYETSSVVVTICNSYQRHVSWLAPASKVKIIHNWVDINIMKPIDKNKNLFLKENKELENKFIVLYAGVIGYIQDFQVLIKAAQSLYEIEEIAFVIVGDGPRKSYLLNIIKKLNMKNIYCFDFQPDEYIPYVYNSASIGIIPMKGSSDPMPSKTWNYLACGKPVIILADEDSEIAKLINQIGAGRAIHCGDYLSLSFGIIELYKNRELRENMGNLGRKYVIENHSKVGCLNQWKEIIMSL